MEKNAMIAVLQLLKKYNLKVSHEINFVSHEALIVITSLLVFLN